jgi:hypothetical protein
MLVDVVRDGPEVLRNAVVGVTGEVRVERDE